jgi:hypothetical protein
MTPEEFYGRFLPYAQEVSERTGLDPRLVLAQAALETGYGRSAPGMNYFGIKSHGRSGGQTLQTSEFEDGRMVSQPASFRGYESPEQSFQDYADFLLSNPRYGGVLSAVGIEDQIAEMAKSGYATDPQYGAKLANIAGKFDPNAAPMPGPNAAPIISASATGNAGVSTYDVPFRPATMDDPFEGMGLLSRFAASRGIAQDAEASPIANLFNILTQKEDPRLAEAAKARGGFFGLLGG